MPLHVYNIIIPGGLGLGEEKRFSLPFGKKETLHYSQRWD